MNWKLEIGNCPPEADPPLAEKFPQQFFGELLRVLLLLYPLLLLLDSVEPGFVRSVVNPHVFLLALIVVATLAPRDDRSLRPSVAEGEGGWSRRTIVVFGISAAIVAGAWVWWSVGRGMLGAVVGALTAVGIVATMWTMIIEEPPANGRV